MSYQYIHWSLKCLFVNDSHFTDQRQSHVQVLHKQPSKRQSSSWDKQRLFENQNTIYYSVPILLIQKLSAQGPLSNYPILILTSTSNVLLSAWAVHLSHDWHIFCRQSILNKPLGLTASFLPFQFSGFTGSGCALTFNDHQQLLSVDGKNYQQPHCGLWRQVHSAFFCISVKVLDIKACPAGSVESILLQCRSLGFSPGSERSPREGNGNPFQYSCLKNLWTEGPGRL